MRSCSCQTFAGTLGPGLESSKGDSSGRRGSCESEQKPGSSGLRLVPGSQPEQALHAPHTPE